MNILITGGAGFIGANLVTRLHAEGHMLRVLDTLSPQIHGSNPSNSPLRQQIEGKCEFIQGDVTDPAVVNAALDRCDAVVHLAAETGTGQSMYEVARYCHTNVQGTAVLLEAIARRKETIHRVVVASSRAIYGEGRYELDGEFFYPCGRVERDLAEGRFEPRCLETGRNLKVIATDEDSRIQPNSIYGLTKYTQEHMTLLSCNALGIGAVALRFQNVYGPGQSLSNPYTGILSIFSTRIRHGLGIDIYEDGDESRDFVYIDDVVESLVLALSRDEANGEAFGIGTGEATSVITVARELVMQYGIEVPLTVTGAYRVGDIRHNFADTTKAERLLGFKARVSFREGIEQFVEWVLKQPIQADSYGDSVESLKKRGLFK
jgi:dTDP-L-rhamnose 4-epimerase